VSNVEEAGFIECVDLPQGILYHYTMKKDKNAYRKGRYNFTAEAMTVGEKRLVEERKQEIMKAEGISRLSNKALLMSLLVLAKYRVTK